MKFPTPFCLCFASALLGFACSGSAGGNNAGTGGGSGAGNLAGQGGSSGSGGALAGASATGGVANGTGGTNGAAPGAGGSSAGSGGAAAGTGGAVSGEGGAVNAAGGKGGGGASAGTTGTTGGAAGTGTTGGAAGAGTTGGAGGNSGTAGAGSGDAYVSGVSVSVHPQVNTLLVVTWTQVKSAEEVWLEFGFAGSSLMTSRPAPGTAGAHRDVVLGVPGSTAISVRIVSKQAGIAYQTKDYAGTTGAVPSGMPKSTVTMYDANLASPDRWLVGAVENSTGGCTSEACYFDGTWWLFAMDRQGRIVWYYADPATNDVSSFPRPARNGEYLYAEKRSFGASARVSGVVKMTLDRQYFQTVSVPLLSDCVDMTTDGTLLYETAERDHENAELRELSPQGVDRAIWSCTKQFGTSFLCYSNTVNWNPATDTVLLSFPEMGTVAEIDRKTGALLATYGSQQGSYAFSPSPWSFVWQHFPVITPQGTLLISSHLPSFTRFAAAAPNHHAFEEFEIDRANKRLVRKWLYGDAASDGPEWAYSRGMATRLKNGNTLANYGSGGVIREITPDKKTVFHVKFDVPTGNDYYNKLVGNTFLIDDLYALNSAPK